MLHRCMFEQVEAQPARGGCKITKDKQVSFSYEEFCSLDFAITRKMTEANQDTRVASVATAYIQVGIPREPLIATHLLNY